MRKISAIALIISGLFLTSLAYSQTDYSAAIIGTWKFDMGAGIMATIEYKKDGSFQQTVEEMIVGGTYSVKGNKLRTKIKGTTTMFTIMSYNEKELTIKRDKDGRTIVYIKQ